jgi:DegV family protein with EDD domain
MYRIVADSSLDVNEQIMKEIPIEHVPFKILLDEENIIDDDTLHMETFLQKMKKAAKLGSACPSPEDFMKFFRKEGDIFAITITGKLSGTYNSAVLAKDLYFDQFGQNKKIHVFDSKLASVGETLVALKIKEMMDKSFSFEEVVEQVEEYISKLKLYFISEKLDNLIKNGRISRLKGTIATALNVKPIMGVDDGEIDLVEKVRGTDKAFARMVEIVNSFGDNLNNRIMAISHADNVERAELLRKEFEKLGKFKEVIVVPMKGLSTMYADNKGIIISF